MRFVYFASVREAVGMDSEERNIPPELETVNDCVDWLGQQGSHVAAFADRTRLRFALDQHMVSGDAKIAGAKELAIFPPVTGG